LYLIPSRKFDDIPGVKVIYPPEKLTKYLGNVPARLIYFLYFSYKHRPDYVGGFHLLFNGMAAQLVAKVLNIKSMYFCVGGPAEVEGGGINSENRLLGKLKSPDLGIEKRLIEIVKGFDLIITMGSSAKKFFESKGVNAQIWIASGGISKSKFCKSKGEAQYDFVFVGRLAPIKRIDILINSINILQRKGLNVTVAIIGDGELMAQLKREVEDLGITNSVKFMGARSDIEYWYSISKIFVLTSDSEGLSLALIEAMMSGLPAIVSDVGDLGDIVDDGVNGFLVRSRDPSAFASSMHELLTNLDLYQKFSHMAIRSAENFSIENATKKWGEILA